MISTMMKRPLLTVVSIADERFFPGLEVAVASAVAAASGNYDYQILIIDGGLAADSLAGLGRRIADIAVRKGISATLEPLVIDSDRMSILPERRGSRMAYAKLILPDILPHLESIIYLDADVLCFAGLETVHPPPDETHWLLVGAQDFHDVIEKDCPWLDQVPMAERRLPYINTGVMWMNLAGLRGVDFTTRSIACTAKGPIRYADQTVLNFLCRGRSYILPDAINHRTSIGATRPLCEGNLDLNIHFIGSPKPWLGPPKTSNWLAHQLWHQAHAALVSGIKPVSNATPPHDHSAIRRKAILYSITNRARARHYRSDLLSLSDPGGVVAKAAQRWEAV